MNITELPQEHQAAISQEIEKYISERDNLENANFLHLAGGTDDIDVHIGDTTYKVVVDINFDKELISEDDYNIIGISGIDIVGIENVQP